MQCWQNILSLNLDISWLQVHNDQAGAPPASPPPAASPAAPSTPEGLREAKGSNLDALAISPTNEEREEKEEDLPISDLKPEHPP